MFLDVVVDECFYTIIADKKVRRANKVLSFEPNPMNLDFVRFNIKLNRLNGATLIPKTIGDKLEKTIIFYSAHVIVQAFVVKIGENMIELNHHY